MFQVAIAVAAISVLTQRRKFFLVSLGFGVIGIFLLAKAQITDLNHADTTTAAQGTEHSAPGGAPLPPSANQAH